MNDQKIAELNETLKATNPRAIKIAGSNNSPRPIRYYNSKNYFTPDILMIFNDKRDFYTIEKAVNADVISELTFKWILFSSEARKNNGQFYLIIDKDKSDYCKKVIADQQLEIELIELQFFDPIENEYKSEILQFEELIEGLIYNRYGTCNDFISPAVISG